MFDKVFILMDFHLSINTIYLISISKSFLDMTINNPIFIFALIIVIWFIPGILVRRINELNQKDKKKKKQAKAIDRLYPKK